MDTLTIKRILVPIDFSLTSLKALDQALVLAKHSHAEITLIHVINTMLSAADPLYFSIPRSAEYEAEMHKTCETELIKLGAKMQKQNAIEIKAVTVQGDACGEILKLAEELPADMIIMGTHGTSGIKEFMLGSNTIRIISKANCPVLSVQQSFTPGFKKILVPFRNKPHSREKLNDAIILAQLYKASIHLLGVNEAQDEEVHHKLFLEAAQMKKIAESQGLHCTTHLITGGYLAKELLGYAKEVGADLIVVMSDLDSMSLSDFILGPVAQQVVNHSHIPILSIRPTFNRQTVDLKGYGW
jgi:nucleotide-binding universal stress UspA family protein